MSIKGGPNIVTENLVLHLDAADKNSYSGSGNDWYDLSGNGNNGTLVNGPTYSSNNVGGIVLDGVNDYISIAENSSMKPTTLTAEMTLKINSTVNSGTGAIYNFQYILFRQNSRTSNFEGYGIAYNELTENFSIFATPSNGTPQYATLSQNNTSPINSINYISAVFDTTSMAIYINGILHSSGVKGTNIDYNNTHTLKIGRSVPIGSSFDSAANATVYSTRMYDRALSNSEILQNYLATKGRFGL